MEKNTHRNVIPVIGERDIIPFGKYKGKALLDVYSQDPSYVHWMADNVSNYKIELNYHWIEILKEDEVAPRNGIYIIACRYDNHLGYEIYKLKKGDCFWGLYKNENAHSDGYYPIDCLAYYKIQEYSPDNKQWSHITTHNLCVNVFAIQQGLHCHNVCMVVCHSYYLFGRLYCFFMKFHRFFQGMKKGANPFRYVFPYSHDRCWFYLWIE